MLGRFARPYARRWHLELELHALTRENDNREYAQGRPKREDGALEARENKDEPVPSPSSDKSARKRGANGDREKTQEHPAAYTGEKPSQERWRRLLTGLTTHRFRREDHHQAECDVNERETPNKSRQPTDNVVKY